jgi:hypothetical protein
VAIQLVHINANLLQVLALVQTVNDDLPVLSNEHAMHLLRLVLDIDDRE